MMADMAADMEVHMVVDKKNWNVPEQSVLGQLACLLLLCEFITLQSLYFGVVGSILQKDGCPNCNLQRDGTDSDILILYLITWSRLIFETRPSCQYLLMKVVYNSTAKKYCWEAPPTSGGPPQQPTIYIFIYGIGDWSTSTHQWSVCVERNRKVNVQMAATSPLTVL